MPFPRIRGIPTQQKRPQFPSVADLPNLSPADAERALSALRVLVQHDLADVYSSAGSNDTRWNVWLNLTWRRVPLQDWATEWIKTWDSMPPLRDPEGGDAA